MAKFKASEAVEALDYDFEDIGNGAKGTITEPSTGLVNGFMKNQKQMMRDVQALQKQVKGLEDTEVDEGEDVPEMTDEELAEKMAKMDEVEEGADLFQKRSMENIAILCGAQWDEQSESLVGGAPTLEDLQSLPYRHLQAFMKWLMEEIRPKRERPAGKR